MNKRILSLTLVILMCLSGFPAITNGSSVASINGTYTDGEVKVTGNGFTGGGYYTIRVVNTEKSSITAMEQEVANGSGEISASITTGVLHQLSNYIIYVNSQDGLLITQDNTIEEEDNSVESYQVVYDGNGNISGSVPKDEKRYKENETITVKGNVNGLSKTGYTFAGWTKNADGSGKVYTTGATLTMGTEDVTLYAKWVTTSSSDNDEDDDNESNEDQDKKDQDKKSQDKKDQTSRTSISTTNDTTTAKMIVEGTIDQNTGKVTAMINSKFVDELLNSAKEAKTSGKKAVVEIKMETEIDAKSTQIVIPKDIFHSIVNDTNVDLKLDMGIASITFDAVAAKGISNMATEGDITIEINKINPSTLTEKTQKIVENRPIYDFSVKAGESQVSNFQGNGANVSIPYMLGSEEDENAVVMYYINDLGKSIEVVRGAYKSETQTVDFKTYHFSKYYIGYNKVDFMDVSATAWYNKAITFIAARGITTGTEENKFSPDIQLTRGQFIVMLMRAYGIEIDETLTENFADAGKTYYTDYLATAKYLKIVNGVGNNRFAPDQEISRQDMFTLLHRVLNLLDELPSTESDIRISDYTDTEEIADYAVSAMKDLVENGIVKGNEGKLNPKGESTRAEMAQVLYNLLYK